MTLEYSCFYLKGKLCNQFKTLLQISPDFKVKQPTCNTLCCRSLTFNFFLFLIASYLENFTSNSTQVKLRTNTKKNFPSCY